MQFVVKLMLFLYVFLSAFHPLYAQTTVEGYYITLNKDTVRGKFIDYPEFNKSPASIIFQPASSTKVILLKPGECISVLVLNEDTYVSYQGRRLTNPTDWQQNSGQEITSHEDAYENVTVFLRELFNNGHYRLYELKDEERSNFYISGDTTRMKELYCKVYVDGERIQESNRFRQQLQLLFSDSLEQNQRLVDRLTTLKYNSKELVNFFIMATTGKLPKTREKYPAQFFAGLGASVNMFNIEGKSSQIDIVTSYKTQVSPVIEIGGKLFSQRNHGRFFLAFRLDAYQYKNSGTISESANSQVSTSFKSTVISLPLSAGYNVVNTDHITLGLSGGAAALLFINNNQYTTVNPGNYTEEVSNSKPLTFTVFGETELTWRKKLSFVAAYYIPTSVGSFEYYRPDHSSAKFGLRYYLF